MLCTDTDTRVRQIFLFLSVKIQETNQSRVEIYFLKRFSSQVCHLSLARFSSFYTKSEKKLFKVILIFVYFR